MDLDLAKEIKTRKNTSYLTVSCKWCHKEVKARPSRILRTQHITCSRKCCSLLKISLFKNKTTTICKNCSIVFNCSKKYLKNTTNPTCSKECGKKVRSLNFSAEGNPRALKLDSLERIMWQKAILVKKNAFKRGYEYNLDYLYLKELWTSQQGKCYYSELPMKLGQKGVNFDTASIDRIDSNKGYVKGNIVFCLYCINMFKSKYSLKIISRVAWSLYRTFVKRWIND